MSGIDVELRELLRRKAGEFPAVPGRLPPDIRRRGQRSQARTVAVAAACLVTVIAASLAGIRAMRPEAVVPGDHAEHELPWHRVGAATVATGSDLGSQWEIRSESNVVRLTVDGSPHTLSLTTGGSIQIAAPGGAFEVFVTAPRVKRISVRPELNGARSGSWTPGTTFEARWLPGQDLGHPNRTWLLPLPRYGYGTATIGDGLPRATSWPPGARFRGQVLSSGVQNDISWAVLDSYEGSQACLRLVAPRTPDEGCVALAPPAEPDTSHFVAAGSAWVILEGAPGMTAQVTHQVKRSIPVCDDIASGSGGGHTSDVETPPAAGAVDTAICIVQFPGPSGAATITMQVGEFPYAAPLQVAWDSGGVTLRSSSA